MPDVDRIILFHYAQQIVYTSKVKSADIEVVIGDNLPPQLMIVITGDHQEPEQVILCSEKKVLTEVKAENAAVVLLSTYYVYNMLSKRD